MKCQYYARHFPKPLSIYPASSTSNTISLLFWSLLQHIPRHLRSLLQTPQAFILLNTTWWLYYIEFFNTPTLNKGNKSKQNILGHVLPSYKLRLSGARCLLILSKFLECLLATSFDLFNFVYVKFLHKEANIEAFINTLSSIQFTVTFR